MWASLKSGSWLTPERLRVYPALLLAFEAIAILVLVVTSDGGHDYLGRPLGTDNPFATDFIPASLTYLSGTDACRHIGAPSPALSSATKLPKRSHAALCGAAAAASLAIAQDEIAASRGTQRVARARQIAIYLAHVGFGLNYTHLGEAFGRDRTTIRHACFRIEDARDDSSLDRALDFLEGALRLHAQCVASGDAE